MFIRYASHALVRRRNWESDCEDRYVGRKPGTYRKAGMKSKPGVFGFLEKRRSWSMLGVMTLVVDTYLSLKR